MSFENRVNNAIREMIMLGYTPKILLDMIARHGAVEAVSRLIHSEDVSYGFTKLWELQRLDLSMENIIQEDAWVNLFTEEERQLARRRLAEYNFVP